MKRYYLILFALIIFNTVKADLGLPTIQAVCRITLYDGQIIEGIISFGKGGYHYSYTPNGFCFVCDNGSYVLKLFNLDFNKFYPDTFNSLLVRPKLYYVENLTYPPQDPPQYPQFLYNDTTEILQRKITFLNNFKLTKKIILYKNLPMTLYVDNSGEKLETVEIELSNLKSFELLRHPSDYWLKMISSANKRLGLKIEEDLKIDDNLWPDYMKPVWYHEIIENSLLYNYLKIYFYY